MQCPHCQLDKPYVQVGAACPHCGKFVPAPPEAEDPQPEAEPEAANDTEIPIDEPAFATGAGPESVEAEPEIPRSPDADPDESG